MRAVNLLPRDDQRNRTSSARVPLLIAVTGVVFVTALGAFASFSAADESSSRRSELRAIEAAIAELPKVRDPVVTQGSLLQERSDRAQALSVALTTRPPFQQLLREVSLVLPADAWLTQLEAIAPATAPPVAPGAAPPPPSTTTAPAGVKIEGATYSHASVARVLARLSVVPSLENVRLTSSARVEPEKVEAETLPNGKTKATPKQPPPFVTFVVSASLRSGAPQ